MLEPTSRIKWQFIPFIPSDGYFHSALGDITGLSGTPDGKVDIRDIARVALNFGQRWP